MYAWKRAATVMGSLAVLPALAAPALAHPHIFAEARLEVAVSDGGKVEALRHVWRFDDLFSSTVLLEFDRNQNLKLDPEELAEVANVVYESLAEFNYFQFVTVNGREVEMRPPERLIADFVDDQLLILFEAQPKEPFALDGTVDFGVYDPTFYTAIDYLEDSYLVVDNLPEGCRRDVVRPAEDMVAYQQSLSESFFNNPTADDIGRLFATKLEIQCSANG